MTREEAIEILKTDGCYECAVEKDSPYNCCDGGCEIRKAYYMAIESLESEIRPVVKGKWKDVNENQNVKRFDHYECSICHMRYAGDYNYCPNCGAEMRERSNESGV